MLNVYKEVYDLDVNKEAVQEFWDNKVKDDVARIDVPGPGIHGSINWEDLVFDSYEDASRWIDENNYPYWQVAVQFKCDVLKHSQEYWTLLYAREDALERIDELKGVKPSFQGNPGIEFVNCPACNSRVAVRFIRHNRCPVCGKDLREGEPDKEIDKLERLIHKLDFQIDKANKKDTEANEMTEGLKWLVKVDI